MFSEEDKKRVNAQLDLVLENLTQMEKEMKTMLTNLRGAVDSFRQALN